MLSVGFFHVTCWGYVIKGALTSSWTCFLLVSPMSRVGVMSRVEVMSRVGVMSRVEVMSRVGVMSCVEVMSRVGVMSRIGVMSRVGVMSNVCSIMIYIYVSYMIWKTYLAME